MPDHLTLIATAQELCSAARALAAIALRGDANAARDAFVTAAQRLADAVIALGPRIDARTIERGDIDELVVIAHELVEHGRATGEPVRRRLLGHALDLQRRVESLRDALDRARSPGNSG